MATIKEMFEQVNGYGEIEDRLEMFEHWSDYDGTTAQDCQLLNWILANPEIPEKAKQDLTDRILAAEKENAKKIEYLSELAPDVESFEQTISQEMREAWDNLPKKMKELSTYPIAGGACTIGGVVALYLAFLGTFATERATYVIFGILGGLLLWIALAFFYGFRKETADYNNFYVQRKRIEDKLYAEYGEKLYYRLVKLRVEAANLTELIRAIKHHKE